MNDKIIHDLAIAYAQAKLLKMQQDEPENNGLNSELRSYIKAYYYACYQIPIEDEDIDEKF